MTVAAIVLAAGQSRRMGRNKLLIEIDGVSLIERAVDAALASAANPVIVVTGHEAAAIRRRLCDRNVTFVDNPEYESGLSTSIRAGIAAVPAECDGALICLADMPGIDSGLMNRLITGFAPTEGREVVVPIRQGKRGNPILWGRRFFPDLQRLTGDIGARHLIAEVSDFMIEIEAETDGIHIDLDTSDALALWHQIRGHYT